MADRPRDDGWWLASDGRWYPPELPPDADVVDTPAQQDASTTVSQRLTSVLSMFLIAASALFVVAAYYGVRYSAALRRYTGILSEADAEALIPIELTWATWSGLTLVIAIIAAVLVIIWTRSTSKRLDARGPIGRRWRGWWTIGAWLIPFANLVIPKLIFNELEKTAAVPYGGVPIGEEWQSVERSQLGDLWWLLWLGGILPGQIIQVVLGESAGDPDRLPVLIMVNSFTYAAFAGAGLSLAVLVRRIERSSRG